MPNRSEKPDADVASRLGLWSTIDLDWLRRRFLVGDHFALRRFRFQNRFLCTKDDLAVIDELELARHWVYSHDRRVAGVEVGLGPVHRHLNDLPDVADAGVLLGHLFRHEDEEGAEHHPEDHEREHFRGPHSRDLVLLGRVVTTLCVKCHWSLSLSH